MNNKLDLQYNNLLKDILENGIEKQTRNGKVLSIFGKQIRHKMSDGFPLLTCKKMYWKGIVTELLWFLKGDTNIKYLIDNNCHIWDGDAYKNYLKWAGNSPLSIVEFVEKIKTDSDFAGVYGELGPIYGKQWRSWGGIDRDSFLNTDNIEDPLLGGRGLFFKEYEIDQIANLINDLKINPDSRRLMVNAWNVGKLDSMVLPPCHYGFQVYTRELSKIERGILYNKQMEVYVDTDDVKTNEHYDKMNIPTRAISLMWNQRSVDTFLGLPFNIASYGLLLEILAKEVNMVPDELIGNLGDTHLYINHIEQAKEQIQRIPYLLPKLKIKLHFKNNPSFIPEYWLVDDFEIENYQSHPAIKASLNN